MAKRKYKYFRSPKMEEATIRLYEALEKAGGPEKFKHIARSKD